MSHVGSLRAQSLIGGDADIRGARVFGKNKEKLGEIIDVVFDHESGDVRYVVVESDGWLHSREFMIPSQELEVLNDDTDPRNDRFRVNLEMQQIEHLPGYDASHLAEERWSEYEQEYKQAWIADPVLHREGSTHSITPTAEEMPIPPGSRGLGIVYSEPFHPRGVESAFNSSGASNITLKPGKPVMETRYEDEASEHVSTHGLDSLRGEVSPITKETGAVSSQNFDSSAAARRLGRRWTTFQDYLRANRDMVAASCQSCSRENKKIA